MGPRALLRMAYAVCPTVYAKPYTPSARLHARAREAVAYARADACIAAEPRALLGHGRNGCNGCSGWPLAVRRRGRAPGPWQRQASGARGRVDGDVAVAVAVAWAVDARQQSAGPRRFVTGVRL